MVRSLLVEPVKETVREEFARQLGEIRVIRGEVAELRGRVSALETMKGRLMVGWSMLVMLATLSAKALWDWVQTHLLKR